MPCRKLPQSIKEVQMKPTRFFTSGYVSIHTQTLHRVCLMHIALTLTNHWHRMKVYKTHFVPVVLTMTRVAWFNFTP